MEQNVFEAFSGTSMIFDPPGLAKRDMKKQHRKVNRCEMMVNKASVLFDTNQIGTRDNPKMYYLHDVGNPVTKMEEATVSIGRCMNGAIAAILFSYGNAIALVDTSNRIEVLRVKHTKTSSKHLKAFMELALIKKNIFEPGNNDISICDLLNNYGTDRINVQGITLIEFPRVTAGMLNKAIKQNGIDDIKVESKTNYILQEIGGMPGEFKTIHASTSLREAYIALMRHGYVKMEQIVYANSPNEIKKYYRGL